MHNCFLQTATLSPGGFMKLRIKDLNTNLEFTQDMFIDKDFLNKTLVA